MNQLIINGITVKEGQQYKHKLSGCIWTIKRNFYNELCFDSGVLERDIIEERLGMVELLINEKEEMCVKCLK